MPTLDQTYEVLLRNLNIRSARPLYAALDKANKDIALKVKKFKLRYPDNYKESLFWQKNKALEKETDLIMKQLQSDMRGYIQGTNSEAWGLANRKNNVFTSDYLSGLKVSQSLMDGYFNINAEALSSFLNRSVQGMNLSDRVWNLIGAKKQALEAYLSAGITTGKSATSIASEIKQFENNPTALYRRVRGEDGKLRLSKAARAYHPGRGVYRSSYGNAFRLSRSENNIAYRLSDFERRKNLDFVVGIEVKLSAAHPKPDICDAMVGKYPKGYIFTGYHPACLCYSTSITLPRDKMRDFLRTGNVDQRYKIRSIPSNAVNYLEKNKDSLLNLKNKPYFLRDNFTNGIQVKGSVLGSGAVAPVSNVPSSVSIPKFNTVKEAEDWAKQYSNGKVSYRGIDLNGATEMNQALAETFGQTELPKFTSIKASSFKNDAYAKTNLLSNDLQINSKVMGNIKKFNLQRDEAVKAIEYLNKNLANITDITKKERIKELLSYEKQLVGTTRKDMILHEIGHHFDFTVLMKNKTLRKSIIDNRFSYISNISSYSSKDAFEYIAESFIAYKKGLGAVIDPKLLEEFIKYGF